MKSLALLSGFLFFSCTSYHPRIDQGNDLVAYDSMADGKVHAIAVKRLEKQEVCFDISISLKSANQKNALPRNWSLAWMNTKNQYYLLNLNQRDPASVPRGGQVTSRYGGRDTWDEWSNTFRTCAPKAQFDDVKGIVLTPRELPYPETRALRLNWK